ncbi:methyl-accepting chemotaxis protein signaling domain protein [Candidatus Magnetomorum sp. HK-1]|nr:methyl-accepting chemotaxis protein signaling domain protein [Candidatus Magnetomorum sp. HK-1]
MKDWSLQAKITTVTSIILTLMLLIICIVVFVFENNMAEAFTAAYKKHFELFVDKQQDLSEKKQSSEFKWMIKILSNIIYPLALDPQAVTIPKWVDIWFSHPDIRAVSITDKKNLPLLSIWKDEKGVQKGKHIPDNVRDHFDRIETANIIDQNNTNLILYAFFSVQGNAENITFINNIRKQIQEMVASNREKLKKIMTAQLIGFLIILVAFITFQIWQFRKLVLRPLSFINRVASRLASFDLTVSHHPKSKDEIGQIFQAYNQVIKAFREILSLAQYNGKKLSDESEHIISIFSRLNTHVNDMEDKSNTVVNAAHQMSSTMTSIASSLNGMQDNVEKISRSTDAMTNNIHSVAVSIDKLSEAMNGIEKNARHGRKVAEKAVDKARETVQTISSLNNAASQIEEIAHIIMSIADKTNLIGLNAAIEAASAGESGRGFSVVAKSIQKFAEQSTKAAINISDKISSVLELIDNSIKKINEIVSTIDEMALSSKTITSSVEEQTYVSEKISVNANLANKNSSEIARQMDTLLTHVQTITNNVDVSAQGAQNVSLNIQSVGKSILDTKEEISDVHNSSVHLEELASNLFQLVDRFDI